MKYGLAEETSVLMLTLNAALNHQLQRIRECCSEDQFKLQKRAFGGAMASLLDIVNPIYLDYPELKPVEIGGSYKFQDLYFEGSLSTLFGCVSAQVCVDK